MEHGRQRETGGAEEGLCRSVLYSALAVVFRRPDRRRLDRAFGEDAAPVLLAAARELDRARGTQAGGEAPGPGPLADLAAALAAAARAPVAELDREHQRLFGHTARGKVPPYETEYGTAEIFRQSQELADLGGFYRAFGLTVPEGERERYDHLSAECEFLSFLACRESEELAAGRSEDAAGTRRAQRLFLREHLGRFARGFARSLSREAAGRFHAAAAQLCLAFITAECEALGVEPGPEHIELRPDVELQVPVACEEGCSLLAGGVTPPDLTSRPPGPQARSRER